MFVIDTDILSIFAKSDNIDLLRELFGNNAVMTPAIFQEITAPIDYGYEFPHAIIQTIRTVQMNEDAIVCYRRFFKTKNWGEVNAKLLHIASYHLQFLLRMIKKPDMSHLNMELLLYHFLLYLK